MVAYRYETISTTIATAVPAIQLAAVGVELLNLKDRMKLINGLSEQYPQMIILITTRAIITGNSQNHSLVPVKYTK